MSNLHVDLLTIIAKVGVTFAVTSYSVASLSLRSTWISFYRMMVLNLSYIMTTQCHSVVH